MPFTLIKGRFKPTVGCPDGDSVRFLANDLSLWNRLEGRPVSLGTTPRTLNTVQLRFEGIDAIEKKAIQPLAASAKNNMLKLIGFDPNTNREPQGYILARMTDDLAGRPICFVFRGETNECDGSEAYLDTAWLRESANLQQIKAGWAYPLYYNTLFASLRNAFDKALAFAQENQRGYWFYDKTTQGVVINSRSDLATIPPIWPKLWRRLEKYLRNAASLDGFLDFLDQANERVDILPIMEECGMEDVVEVRGNEVRMNELPENLRVVGQTSRRKRPLSVTQAIIETSEVCVSSVHSFAVK